MPLSLAIVWLWAMGLAEPVMMSTRPDIFFFLLYVCVCVFMHCGRPICLSRVQLSTWCRF